MSEYVSMSHIIDRKSRFKVQLAYKNVFFYNILIFSFVLGKVFKRWELQIFKFRYIGYFFADLTSQQTPAAQIFFSVFYKTFKFGIWLVEREAPVLNQSSNT